jgi:phage gp36-like protein
MTTKITPIKILLDKHYMDKLPLTKEEQKQMYNEVSGYISNLERNLFKTSKKQQYEGHTERVLAFHDFLRLYSIPRGKSIEWALSVFRRRFANVETTLTIRRKMNVDVPGAEVGFQNPFVMFVKAYLTARRECGANSSVAKFFVNEACVEAAYFKGKQFAGKRARQHYHNQVAHHKELLIRSVVALSLEEIMMEINTASNLEELHEYSESKPVPDMRL